MPLQKTREKERAVYGFGLVREPSSKSFLSDIQDQAKDEGLSNSVPSAHLLRFVTLGEALPPLL